jgi:hypothetical protein
MAFPILGQELVFAFARHNDLAGGEAVLKRILARGSEALWGTWAGAPLSVKPVGLNLLLRCHWISLSFRRKGAG